MIASLAGLVTVLLPLVNAGVTAPGHFRAEAPPAIAEMVLFSDGQHVAVNENFPDPVAVNLLDSNGQGVPGAAVTLTIESGTATFLVFTHGEVAADGQSAVATTDTGGSVAAGVHAGSTPGRVVISVRAAQHPGQEPAQPDVVKQFTLFVEPAGFVPAIPKTGGDTTAITIAATATVTLGAGLLIIRRRGRGASSLADAGGPLEEANGK